MQQLPFLRDFVLSREHLAEFSAFCDPLVFEKGEDLLARGRSGEHMLFLLSGSAEVKVGPTRCVAIVAPDFCGESCMANPGRKRNATITATTRVECLKLSRRRLFLLYEYFAVDDECGAEAGASRVQAAMDKLVFKAGGPPSIQELQHACDAYSAAQEGRRRSRSGAAQEEEEGRRVPAQAQGYGHKHQDHVRQLDQTNHQTQPSRQNTATHVD